MSNYFGFDPELPAGYQDADIEMLELRAAANEQADLCKAGTHDGWEDRRGSLYCIHCMADLETT